MKHMNVSQVVLASVVGMACICVAGCGHNEVVSEASIAVTSSNPISPNDETASLGPFQDLLGTWRGTSYQHESGMFRMDAPREAEPVASIQMQIEVEGKYLQLKGLESCQVTLSYMSQSGEEFKARKMFRIFLPKDPETVTERSGPLGVRKTETLNVKDYITFESGVMKFEVISLQDNSMELLGRFVSIKSMTIPHAIRLKLSRTPASALSEADESMLPREPLGSESG